MAIAGIAAALDDAEHLTSKARKLLTDVRFQLELMTERGRQAAVGKRGSHSEAAALHLMLSYCWSQQAAILRIRAALGARGYNCWVDVEQMQGSTVDAMANAVDNAYAVCVGISAGYKESSNCRLEAMYAHQINVGIIPLMLEEGYRANGWLGLLLGTRMWYGFYGPALDDAEQFEKKVGELAAELDRRLGREKLGEPAAAAPTAAAAAPPPPTPPPASAAAGAVVRPQPAAASVAAVQPPPPQPVQYLAQAPVHATATSMACSASVARLEAELQAMELRAARLAKMGESVI